MSFDKQHNRNHQGGMALLVILLVVALMATIAVLMSERWFMGFQRTDYLRQTTQGKWFAHGAEEVIKAVLLRDGLDDAKHTHFGQYWATSISAFPIENALLKVKLKDARACLNLNAINRDIKISPQIGSPYESYPLAVMMHLFETLSIDAYQAQEMIASLQDWIDNDDLSIPYGAEDTTYINSSEPYLAANQPLTDLSELRLINGFSPEIIHKISSYVCVIPSDDFIVNINTLRQEDALLLESLSLGSIDLSQAKQLIEERPKTGWNTLEDFYIASAIDEAEPIKRLLDQSMVLNSDFFSAKFAIQFDEHQVNVNSLFHRKEKKVNVIHRNFEVASEE